MSDDESEPETGRPSEERLVPARVDDDRAGDAYRPRVPWKWLVIAVLGIGSLISIYVWKENQRTEELRSEVLSAYEERLAVRRRLNPQ